MTAFVHREELLGLLDALCEETIAPEQTARLEELILKHPEAEALYIQYLSMVAHLTRDLARPAAVSPRAPLPPGTPRRRPPSLWGLTGLAGLAAGVLLMLMFGDFRTPMIPPAAQGGEPTDRSVAVLLQTADARWEDPTHTLHAGAALPPGRLRLAAGLACLEFYSGATLLLEGPAEVQLLSPGQATLVHGKARVSVPVQAAEFHLSSPVQGIKRGSEFGVRITEAGEVEVDVFQGKVTLDVPEKTFSLGAGQAVRLDGKGARVSLPADERRFVSARDLAVRSNAEQGQWQGERRAAVEALRRDPDLLGYYPFEERNSSSRILTGQAGAGKTAQGVIVSCQWVAGRWPGKAALEFKRAGDRVRIEVPGEHRSLTLAAWVRLDGLDRIYNSLVLADGYDEGAVHWQVGQNGRLILGVQGPGGRGGRNHDSPPIFTPGKTGQWSHLAVVCDGVNRRVSHYVDGQLVKRQPLLVNVSLRIGRAEIGNWNPANRADSRPIRNFNGRMDELLILSRPLTEPDVRRLFVQGRPRS